MSIVFMGTPDFAVVSLQALLDAGRPVTRVVTQPDRPRGRGRKRSGSPVKVCALRAGIEVWQPERVRDAAFIGRLREAAPGTIVVVAYGQILPRAVLDIPPLGCINLHASLLPRYRGAAPIHRAIMNGDTVTGVTTMYMDEGMDTGDIILQAEVPIRREDTVGTLHDRLAAAGAALLVKTVALVRRGEAPRRPQDSAAATYAPRLTGEDELIRWSRSAEQIRNHVRGMDPWPGACTRIGKKRVKIWRVEVEGPDADGSGQPGQVLAADPDYGIMVQAGDGRVVVTELQPPGGRRMSAGDYLRGHRVSERTLWR